MGEGIQLWDLRNLDKPTSSIKWTPGSQNRDPLIYTCKFVPNTDLIIAGGRDAKAAKCFDAKKGSIIKEFPI